MALLGDVIQQCRVAILCGYIVQLRHVLPIFLVGSYYFVLFLSGRLRLAGQASPAKANLDNGSLGVDGLGVNGYWVARKRWIILAMRSLEWPVTAMPLPVRSPRDLGFFEPP